MATKKTPGPKAKTRAKSPAKTSGKATAKKASAATKKSVKKPTAKPRKKPAGAKPSRGIFWRLVRGFFKLSLIVAIPLLLALAAYTLYLDQQIQSRFEGRRWQLPARVYARPLELYAGQAVSQAKLTTELRRLGYSERLGGEAEGSFQQRGSSVVMHAREFEFWDGKQPDALLKVQFAGNSISRITDRNNGSDVALARLDPPQIGSFYPSHGEDRILVQLKDVPPLLPAALIEIEDGDFEQHHGLDFSGIARAFVVNLRAGRVKQGGSTLTQQLVKNYFLTNERSYVRKFNEAIMSLLLELRYSKEDILEAYMNEVYLGQDGKRAIHGFGLASQFYFGKPLRELNDAQIALMVAIVKGPSYYRPRKYTERATDRRNLVLTRAEQTGLLSPRRAESARNSGLQVTVKGSRSDAKYPAFMQLVRQQLRRDYREEDLTSEGLRIFTTIDPLVQSATANAVSSGLNRLNDTELQAAAVVTDTQGGEVLAMVGDRQAGYAGFNRAMDARRPVGSVIKPAVYLTALESGFTLASPLRDTPVEYKLPDGDIWRPENYDRKVNGEVLLYQALMRSLNLSTVNLGLELGVDQVANTIKRLGYPEKPPAYGSLLLGAVDMSPLEVAQIYYPLAAGGFRTPLNGIREVLTAEGQPLKRYPLQVEQVADPAATYLLTRGLLKVMREGTGKRVWRTLPDDFDVAGKTGTTDGLRDAWFAGYSGDRLAVVWVGRDDNKSTGLTGSSGALPLWADIIKATSAEPLSPIAPDDVEDELVDTVTGLRADDGCEQKTFLPFVAGTKPTRWADCALGDDNNESQPNSPKRKSSWWQKLF